MTSIIHVDEDAMAWVDYVEPGGDGPSGVRSKALTRGTDAPPMQYVEYAPGHRDRVHRHDTGEVFIIREGSFHVDGAVSGPGAVVYIPRGVDYAVVAGAEGVRFFRIVVP